MGFPFSYAMIIHEKLYKVANDWSYDDCFEYSKQAEMHLASLLQIEEYYHSRGYEPGFDIATENCAYEIKFQASELVFIEYRQSKSFLPSGICTTTSKYWLIVNHGRGQTGEIIGKVRQYAVETLRYVMLHTPPQLAYESRLGFSSWDIPHVWLGDIRWDNAVGAWDMSQFIRIGSPLLG